MSYFILEIDNPSGELIDNGLGDTATAYADGGEDISARISNPDAENGHPTTGPLSWLNSARITARPGEDAVHCVVSVGDPRGGFCFTVRRLNDGRLVIHCPHPGEGMPHCTTRETHPGTLEVANHDGSEPADFSDTARQCDECGDVYECEDGEPCPECGEPENE